MLNDLEVIAIRRAHRAGIPQREIADRFKVSGATVSNVVRHRSHDDVLDIGQATPRGRQGSPKKSKPTWNPVDGIHLP